MLTIIGTELFYYSPLEGIQLVPEINSNIWVSPTTGNSYPGGSYPKELALWNNHLIFDANDGDNKNPWCSWSRIV